MDAAGINVTLSPSLHRATITSNGAVGIGVLAPEILVSTYLLELFQVILLLQYSRSEPLAVIAFPFDLAPNRDQFRT
jgi:hypothetical protein